MKKLFSYYSYTGNGDVVAEALKEKGFEIRKVIRKRKMPKSFFFGILHGGFLAATNHKDKLVDYNENVDEYENIFIGSPIWNARLSSPINTVLAKTNLTNKNLTFIFYAGSGTGEKALKKINKLYPSAKVIFLKEPKKYPEELSKLDF